MGKIAGTGSAQLSVLRIVVDCGDNWTYVGVVYERSPNKINVYKALAQLVLLDLVVEKQIDQKRYVKATFKGVAWLDKWIGRIFK